MIRLMHFGSLALKSPPVPLSLLFQVSVSEKQALNY